MTASAAPIGARSRIRRSALAGRAHAGRRYAGAITGTVIVVALVIASYLPTRYSPFVPTRGASLTPPNGAHWFGTDGSGLDVFSRTLRAARTDIPVALCGSVLSMVIGVALGLLLSRRGRITEVVMRLVDVWQTLPLLIVTLAIVSLAGASPISLTVGLVFVGVPMFIRLERAEASVVRTRRYVEAAEACGASQLRIAIRHVLPNTTSVIFAQLSIAAAQAILVIAALGFLGAGVNPPAASWGALVQDGSQYMAAGQWWVATFPSIAILLVVVAFNLISDGLYLISNRGARR